MNRQLFKDRSVFPNSLTCRIPLKDRAELADVLLDVLRVRHPAPIGVSRRMWNAMRDLGHRRSWEETMDTCLIQHLIPIAEWRRQWAAMTPEQQEAKFQEWSEERKTYPILKSPVLDR